MTQYSTLKLPTDLMQTIEEMLKTNRTLGYRSRTDFVIGIVRKELEQMEKKG